MRILNMNLIKIKNDKIKNDKIKNLENINNNSEIWQKSGYMDYYMR